MSRPRVFISHDGWLGSAEKDDFQSLIHALMFQDRINIQGIAATGSRWGGHQKVADTHNILDTYAQDWAKLNAHASGFKTAEALQAITYQGKLGTQPTAGHSTATASSNAIIKEAKEAAAAGEKLWVLCWGGTGDVAQALHDDPSIAKHIRLYSISNQDPNANRYLVETFAGKGDFWWIKDTSTHFGIYASPDERYTLIQGFHDVHAKGHGALGERFYTFSLDVIGLKGVKMGDSPSVLYLIDRANNDDPTAESWGGEWRQVGTNFWTDRTDNAFNWSPSNGARTIYEDRAAWLKDFAARFDWLKSSTTATDTVTVKLGGSFYRDDPDAAVILDGREIGRATITADYETGRRQTIALKGEFDSDGIQTHRLSVRLLNDAWDRTAATTDAGHDRNLYVESLSINGVTRTVNTLITYGTAGWDLQV